MMISAEAPSNIALIKYMGKLTGVDRNRPTNSSFSLTLPHLRTRVEIISHDSSSDQWMPLDQDNEWKAIHLSDKGRLRYLSHFAFLKQKLNISGTYLVKSANNFPADCGIASSASSFAALTMAAYELAQSMHSDLDLKLSDLADLSRIGSGSSIRSFFSPLVIWDRDGVRTHDCDSMRFRHQVVVVDGGKKTVSSSDAHAKVNSSLLFAGRPERAEQRLSELLSALKTGDWVAARNTSWAEFWDMHALFATAHEPFHYMTGNSLFVLQELDQRFHEVKDGPIVTMDAGANIHLIYREEQKSEFDYWLSRFQKLNFKVFSSDLI